jgi:uncharacterized protein
VVRPSAIAGSGLFATAAIPAGAVVLRFGGHLVDSATLVRLIETASRDPSASYVDSITILDDAHLVLPVATLLHFGNHSCDPNL